VSALKLAINTGGGDAPGLNAVIQAVTLAAERRGWEVYGIQSGYAGLLDTTRIRRLTPERVAGIASLGGTILGTTNRGNPFRFPTRGADGTITEHDISDQLVANFRTLGLDVLVAVGGDGSLGLASQLSHKGMPVIGVPKTIDNDLTATFSSFGFDTAVQTATDAIDKLHSTASAHERVLVVEVMGRYAGWIALHSGMAGSADVILIPEIPFDLGKMCAHLQANEQRGKRYGIVVVAEGACPKDGKPLLRVGPGAGEPARLGGIGEWVANEIAQRTGKETRSLVLGHLQRGGSPTPWDRLLALRFGAAAVRFIADGKRNVMVSYKPPDMVPVPLEDAVSRMKLVPVESDTVLACRDIGISFGD
jgi:6-phosphofructokinase 1